MIYLDNAATTKTFASSAEIFSRNTVENFFNPSALYLPAVNVAKDIKMARDYIKKSLHAPDGELYFMSGGTEADNMALFCTRKPRGSRIIISLGEHDAIINTANQLKEQGYDVQQCPIKNDGCVDIQEFEKLLNENVSLVSIMQVSNETGGINDIQKLVRLTKKYAPKAVFHSDGVQAFCKIKVNLSALGVDLYSISGHKIHAPKGIGALFVKKGVSIKPLLFGGGQEKGMRSGTENPPMILAFENSIKENFQNFDSDFQYKQEYIKCLKNSIIKALPSTIIISTSDSASHILTVAFDVVRGEVLLHTLEKHNIYVGIGSACSSHRESRFKSLLGLDASHRDGIIRFSISNDNKIEEIDFVVEKLVEEINILKNFKRV